MKLRLLSLQNQVVSGFALIFGLTSCSNSTMKALTDPSLIGASPSPGASGAPGQDNFIISTVTVGTSAGAQAGKQGSPSTSIFFDTAKSTSLISTHCNSSTSA